MMNRFKAVEMGIFAVVSLIFLNSVYNLFTDGKFLGGGERRPLAAYKGQPTGPGSEKTAEPAQAPASPMANTANGNTSTGFVPYETKCQSSGEVFETSAAKMRILGPFCGSTGRNLAGDNGAKGNTEVADYRIENSTTHYTATVFSDFSAGKFSTDFIPLEPGPNKVVMEFRYKNGKVFPVELTVIRK